MRTLRTWWEGRPYAPWRLVAWIGRQNIWCWAALVAWKTLKGDTPSRVSSCVAVAKDGGLTCYCGYWDTARCPANLDPR